MAKEPTKKRKANPALSQPMKASKELAVVIGDKPMSRGQVVKQMWVYIKANKLQDSKDKRMINADDKLKPIFGGLKQVSMFQMAKHLSNHLSK